MCIDVDLRTGYVTTNTKKSLLFLLLLTFLCSCGDETTKVVENKTLNYESYDTIGDLPDCTEENQGQMAWVDDESLLRICADEKWYAMVSNDSVPKSLFSCFTEMNEDSSGYTVICNGDSIGFVRNGKLVDEGNKSDEGCSVLLVVGDTLEIACDSLVSFLVRDSSGVLNPQETGLDSEQVALNLENIEGYSQKGPFVTGSEVVVYELQNGRTLKQTGKSFQGSITNDKGAFNIRSVKIASQYAYLVAKGVYLNEISGEKSDAQIQLSAITDLRNRNNVNVNILTHLEYERIVNLVTKKKMSVANAKKQAQSEIFDAFHVNSEKFKGGSEDFSIGGTGEEDAALLAISIILQGDDNTADLSKRINAVSSSIADSGVCDALTMLDLAKWAASADSLGNFAEYREHVKNMGLSVMVADFEKYIRNFWNREFDLEECDTLGKIVVAKRSELKSSSSRFICEDKYGIKSWRYATVEEKDVYGKEPSSDGALDTLESGNVYVYDSVLAITNGNGWRTADEREKKYGGCRMELDGKVVMEEWNWNFDFEVCGEHSWDYLDFVCDGEQRRWIAPRNCFMVDTYGWKDSTDGSVRGGNAIEVTGRQSCYVYDSLDGAWREIDAEVCGYGVGGCTRARVGRYFKNENESFYRCEKDLKWKEEDASFAKNIWLHECLPWVKGLVDSLEYYVCRNGTWRKADEMETLVGAPCFDQDSISYSADSAYVCYTGAYVNEFFRLPASGWRPAESLDKPMTQKDYLNEELTYDSIVDSRDKRVYKTIKIGEDTWTAENMLYFDRMVMNDSTSCYGDQTSGCEMWRQYYWPVAMKINGQYLSSRASELISENHQGVCPEGWHIPSVAESEALLAAAGSFEALLSAKRRLVHGAELEDFHGILSGQSIEDVLHFITGTNSSGFSGISGADTYTYITNGYEFIFEKPHLKTCWWTSDEVSNGRASAFCASLEDDFTLIETRSKEDQLPVRCVKNREGEE